MFPFWFGMGVHGIPDEQDEPQLRWSSPRGLISVSTLNNAALGEARREIAIPCNIKGSRVSHDRAMPGMGRVLWPVLTVRMERAGASGEGICRESFRERTAAAEGAGGLS